MSLDNDETDRVLEEERPGPNDLESALVSVTLRGGFRIILAGFTSTQIPAVPGTGID